MNQVKKNTFILVSSDPPNLSGRVWSKFLVEERAYQFFHSKKHLFRRRTNLDSG